MYQHLCENCGEKLTYMRYNAKYCGPTCRKQAERKRKKESAQALYNDGMTTISKFSKVSPKEREKAIEGLKALRAEIDNQLRGLKDADTIAKYEMLANRQGKV